MGPDPRVGKQGSTQKGSLSCRDSGCCERVDSGPVKHITIFVSSSEKYRLTWLRAGAVV